MLRVWSLVVTLLASTQGFLTYDVDDPDASITTLDLTDTQECPDVEGLYDEGTNVTIQVIQTASELPITTSICKVVVSKTVTHCGFDSITYPTIHTILEENVPIEAKQCKEAFDKKRITIWDQVIQIREDRESTDHLYYSVGHVDPDGTCYTESRFRSGRRYYYNAYEQTHLRVTIRETVGIIDLTQSEPTAIIEGVHDLASKGHLLDPKLGTAVWGLTQPKCNDQESLLYEGVGRLFKPTKNTSLVKEMLLIDDQLTDQHAAYLLKEPNHLCSGTRGPTVRRTHIKEVSIRFTDPVIRLPGTNVTFEMPSFEFPKFQPLFDQKHIDLHSQLAYRHLTNNMQVAEKITTVFRAICEQERIIAKNALAVIAAGTSPYALHHYVGPGIEMTILGSVAYVIRGKPLEATLRDYKNCTKEVPISTSDERDLFADPFSWVLKEVPSVIPCSTTLMPRFRIGNRWFCTQPEVIECTPPDQLKPTSNPEEAIFDFSSSLDTSIFSKEQKAAHRQFLQKTRSRQAILTQISNSVMGANGHGTQSILRPVDFDAIRDDVQSAFFPLARQLGAWFLYFVGIYVLFSFGGLILGFILRTYYLLTHYGCGGHLWAGLTSGLFAIFLFPLELIARPGRLRESLVRHVNPNVDVNIKHPDTHFGRLRQDLQRQTSTSAANGTAYYYDAREQDLYVQPRPVNREPPRGDGLSVPLLRAELGNVESRLLASIADAAQRIDAGLYLPPPMDLPPQPQHPAPSTAVASPPTSGQGSAPGPRGPTT